MLVAAMVAMTAGNLISNQKNIAKKNTAVCGVFLILYLRLGTSFLPSFFSWNHSINEPVNQYGITKVNKNIMSQKPMVKMDKKVRNPKY